MQILYKECYNIKNKTFYPLLQIGFKKEEKHIIPDYEIKYEYYNEEENIYIIDIPFFNGIFSNLNEDTILRINTLFDFGRDLIEKDYITSNIWKHFLFISSIKIPPIEKNIKTNFLNYINETKTKYTNLLKVQNFYLNLDDTNEKDIKNIQLDYSKWLNNKAPNINIKYKMIKSNSADFNQDFINKQELEADFIISYSSYCKNELELIYAFLNIIFSTQYDYKLFNCYNCSSFFIDIHASHIHCTYCRKVVLKEQKEKYYSKEIVKLENRIDSQYSSPYVSKKERDTYYTNKKNMKGKYKNREDKQRKWYLEHDRAKRKTRN